MAAHPHRGLDADPGASAAARSNPGAKLLIAVQWGLTLFGVFCLIGAAVAIASTPEAWPL